MACRKLSSDLEDSLEVGNACSAVVSGRDMEHGLGVGSRAGTDAAVACAWDLEDSQVEDSHMEVGHRIGPVDAAHACSLARSLAHE